MRIHIVVAGIALALSGCASRDTRPATTKERLSNVMNGLGRYRVLSGELPDRLNDLLGLEVHGEPITRELLRDGWNNAFLYERRGKRYALRSLGADGVPGGKGTAADIEATALETALHEATQPAGPGDKHRNPKSEIPPAPGMD